VRGASNCLNTGVFRLFILLLSGYPPAKYWVKSVKIVKMSQGKRRHIVVTSFDSGKYLTLSKASFLLVKQKTLNLSLYFNG